MEEIKDMLVTAESLKYVHDSLQNEVSDAQTNDIAGNEIQRVYASMIPYGVSIPKNSDLNTTEFLAVGNYFCSQNTTVGTLSNCPTSLAFMMQVYSPLSTVIDNETTKTWIYRLRKLITHKGDEYYQFVNSGATVGAFIYGEWIKTSNETDLTQKADKSAGVYYIEGTGSTAGTWLGTHEDITSYYDGLMIAYKIGAAGASTTTLNINNLGAVNVVRNATTAVGTIYPVNSVIFLVYTTDSSGTSYWKTHEYCSNTRNTVGDYRKNGVKLYFVGATTSDSSTTSSYATSYTNSYCYVGTDNCLYSNGKKVLTEEYMPSIPSALPNPNKLTINGVEYDGSEAVDVKVSGGAGTSVKTYGAVGDGATDDTEVFRAALAAERVVFVPGGTYILSGELIIRANCCLELSQDTVLKFTQTDENCISMLRSASLKGNHATISVPYAFAMNVINCDTGYDEAALEFDRTLTGDDYKKAIASANNIAVPPFTKWDPQWKMTRYVTDINICKPDSRGFHYSMNGDCYGSAVYLHCNAVDNTSYMWGVNMSGVRIAGGFNYGIRIYNIGETASSWNHDMRIEAVIDACKTGVSVENCRYARLAVTIQPRQALASDGSTTTSYARHGIELIDSRGVDLSSSRVWDWMNKNKSTGEYITLFQPGGQYQHLALYGECMGLVLDDYLYYAQSTYDIRELIHTDTQSNFDTMVILQEPFTRYFKPIEGEPYFTIGTANKKLMTDDALDDYFATSTVKGFSDVLSTATDGKGNIFNDIGYIKRGYYVVAGTGEVVANAYSGCTGYIPIKAGETLYVKGVVIPEGGHGQANFITYDANYSRITSIATNNAGFYNQNGWYFCHVPLDDGFAITVQSQTNTTNTAYIRFCFQTAWVTSDVIMASVNEEIKYIVEGFLADSVKVKGDNIIVMSSSGKSFKLIVSDDGVLSTEPIE